MHKQGFAMKDRIDYSCFSEKLDNGEVNLYSVLPNSEDYQLLKQNFAIHISRIIQIIYWFSKRISRILFHDIFHTSIAKRCQ